MSRFNVIKTSFTADSSETKLANSIPREVKARVNDIYKSQDPNNQNLYFIKASIISTRIENELSVEPTVKGSGKQVPQDEFLLNELTNILLIRANDDLPLPSPGDEISAEIVTSEITKELNIDGYYKRIIKSGQGVFTKTLNEVVENLKDSFSKRNSLANSDFELPPIVPVSPDQKDLNPQILQLARSISGYVYQQTPGGSGIPFDNIIFKNNRILAKDNFVYCSGFTLYVCYTVAKQAGLLEGKTVSEIKKFHRDWYGISGETNLLSGFALSNLGIGINVSWADAKPGDICQLWRSESGHSVIFLDWIYDNNNDRIGISYRSSQTSTGVSNNREYLIGKNPKKPNPTKGIDPNRLYFARLIIK